MLRCYFSKIAVNRFRQISASNDWKRKSNTLLKLTVCNSTNVPKQYHNVSYGFDSEYPGTAVNRMLTVRDRVKSLTEKQLSEDWASVRRHLLWAGGLKDIKGAPSGMGNTELAFNDFNHCDLVAVKEDFVSVEAENRGIVHIASTQVGYNMSVSSERDLGPGGSWTTCMMGCSNVHPTDVAHAVFKSRIAFKLVWIPQTYSSFVLVDDDGNYLNKGTPKGKLPDILERVHNYEIVQSSKYATAANILTTTSHGRPPSVFKAEWTRGTTGQIRSRELEDESVRMDKSQVKGVSEEEERALKESASALEVVF